MESSGFTAFLCASSGCGVGDAGSTAARTLDTLRGAVGASRLGVLVSTGCLLGSSFCAARATSPVVLVQPCDAERRPTACAVLVGPLRTDEDVAAVAQWLVVGDLDPGLLAPHLVDVHRRLAAAARN